ncbi:hypothetical protein LU293_01600 [Moraxella nasovis]|uniref:NfeD family protein n=1 Tax=Moraxella nasovis TaxID=2904121 RepID=UPI001F61EBE9|nr:hypothetical protein [Moraxella nasovis]UNU73633.1 hypothetical protein LU293_01600 [Moraxella nasovis]
MTSFSKHKLIISAPICFVLLPIGFALSVIMISAFLAWVGQIVWWQWLIFSILSAALLFHIVTKPVLCHINTTEIDGVWQLTIHLPISQQEQLWQAYLTKATYLNIVGGVVLMSFYVVEPRRRYFFCDDHQKQHNQ